VGYATKLRHLIGDVVGRPRRWRLLELMPKRAICAEIGVYKGDFSRDILRVTQPSELHLIDGWWMVEGDAYDVGWYLEQGTADTRTAYHEVQELAARHPQCSVHIGDDLKILPTFPENYFDWVYLDTSHTYDQTIKELEALRRVVKPNGLIAGHDWYPDPEHVYNGVYEAVTEYRERYGGKLTTDGEWRQWLLTP
jgi:SAM-dependent methyltransferase